ncbi:MAG: hypothetical protein IIA67_00895 [Planctomycetes bacterium]|nr:hypothetical protein [Planctomycetota bacterium]
MAELTLSKNDIAALADALARPIADAVCARLASRLGDSSQREYFTEREVAARFAVSTDMLEAMRKTGQIVPQRTRRPLAYKTEYLATIEAALNSTNGSVAKLRATNPDIGDK